MDQRVQKLYLTMPGAQQPDYNDETKSYDWGPIIDTTHWAFCEEIVYLIDINNKTEE